MNVNTGNRKEGEYDICPFDKEHEILKSRMSTHISRCKRNHKDFKMCPYNSNHYSKNLEEHLKICPNKSEVNMSDFIVPKVDKVAPPKPTPADSVVEEASWDDEETNVTYNPIKTLESKDVIRADKKLLAKAERKQFLEEENARLLQIRQKKGGGDPKNNKKN